MLPFQAVGMEQEGLIASVPVAAADANLPAPLQSQMQSVTDDEAG